LLNYILKNLIIVYSLWHLRIYKVKLENLSSPTLSLRERAFLFRRDIYYLESFDRTLLRCGWLIKPVKLLEIFM